MLDPKIIKNEPYKIEEMLHKRGITEINLKELQDFDFSRRQLLQHLDEYRKNRNIISKQISERKKKE